jgi:hypothetical protein
MKCKSCGNRGRFSVVLSRTFCVDFMRGKISDVFRDISEYDKLKFYCAVCRKESVEYTEDEELSALSAIRTKCFESPDWIDDPEIQYE